MACRICLHLLLYFNSHFDCTVEITAHFWILYLASDPLLKKTVRKYFSMSGKPFVSCTSDLIFRQRWALDETRWFYFTEFQNLSWKNSFGWSKMPYVCSSSPSIIGSPDSKPTSIHLISWWNMLCVFLSFPVGFFIFSKNWKGWRRKGLYGHCTWRSHSKDISVLTP